MTIGDRSDPQPPNLGGLEQSSRFLYYYFSVLCKSFKELFLLLRDFPKADAKVRLFLKTPKLLGGFFLKRSKKNTGT
jgi:hypothetical protein